ncbi:ribosome silencing factor [Haematospirillum sp. 15-248]|uniref:ribosome silencing factor n=1 Tax=Haematospirillum sp. 15-248 TaxID=2723107 RepID=UPI001439318D|nr:ribosome silencing factor [Haematospirillum sp. 15-248]NKD87700.1 ribosome silencing factor [Haematospirillum sp. 15-248]
MPEERTIHTTPAPQSHKDDLPGLIGNCLDANKAEHITVIDIRDKTSAADTMIIASGRSPRHVSALAGHVVDMLREHGIRAATEGRETCDWVLIDAGDILVHLFRPEVRAFYNLERMWGGGNAPVPENMVHRSGGNWEVTA